MSLEIALEIQTRIRGIIAQEKRRQKLIERSGSMSSDTHTRNALQKVSTDISWAAMELEKAKIDLHAVCVDYGLADPRADYEPVAFHPSVMHKYFHQPKKPKCRL